MKFYLQNGFEIIEDLHEEGATVHSWDIHVFFADRR